MRLVNTAIRWGMAATVLMGVGVRSVSAGLLLTVENAGVQQTSVTGVTTENFNNFSTGSKTTLNTAVGTITSGNMQINRADEFGGAGGGGKYLAVGGGNALTTLTFNSAQAYFGFWWSAADSSNAFDIYSGSTLLGSFNPTTALSALSNAYKGNPTGPYHGDNSDEKYAYLNFYGTGGTTITKIVFTNLNSTSRLEMDNFSIRSTPVPPTQPGTPIGGIESVPEPSSLALAGAASILAATVSFRRARRGRR